MQWPPSPPSLSRNVASPFLIATSTNPTLVETAMVSKTILAAHSHKHTVPLPNARFGLISTLIQPLHSEVYCSPQYCMILLNIYSLTSPLYLFNVHLKTLKGFPLHNLCFTCTVARGHFLTVNVCWSLHCMMYVWPYFLYLCLSYNKHLGNQMGWKTYRSYSRM